MEKDNESVILETRQCTTVID